MLGKEKITRSPLRFNKKDQSSLTSYQRSLQTSQRHRRGRGKRGSSSPSRTPPRERSHPRHGRSSASGAPCAGEGSAAQERGYPAPARHRRGTPPAGHGAALWLRPGEAPQHAGPPALRYPLPAAAGKQRERPARRGWGLHRGPSLGQPLPSTSAAGPGRAEPAAAPGRGPAPEHRALAPQPPRAPRTALTWPGPARRERAAPAAALTGAEPPLAPGRPRPEMSGERAGSGGSRAGPLGISGAAPAPSAGTPEGQESRAPSAAPGHSPGGAAGADRAALWKKDPFHWLTAPAWRLCCFAVIRG